AFHAAALAAGGRDDGKPGPRHYHAAYYAAFVLDPDGHRIEAVCHAPEAPAIEPGWRGAASRPDGRARRSLLTRRSPPPDVGGWRSRGKALPIFGSHVKRKICPNRKYFCFTESKSRLHLNPSRPGKR